MTEIHETAIDARKKREELKAQRNRLFEQYLRNPSYTLFGSQNQDNRRSSRGIHGVQHGETGHLTLSRISESRLSSEVLRPQSAELSRQVPISCITSHLIVCV